MTRPFLSKSRQLIIFICLAVLLSKATAVEDGEEVHSIQTIGDYLNSVAEEERQTSDKMEGKTDKSKQTTFQGLFTKPYAKLSEETLKEIYENFKLMYHKNFANMDDVYRFNIFKKNLKKIEEHNSKASSYKMAITEFSILTDEEFESEFLNPPTLVEQGPNLNIGAHGRLLTEATSIQSILAKLPAEVDWTRKNKVTSVKHQQQCQGCYVFSAVAALESAILIRHNTQIILSEQEIIDCSQEYQNNGCVGGQPSYVYDYIMNKGINLDDNYPYSGKEEKCKVPTMKGIFKRLRSYIYPEKNVISLIQYLQYGPIAVNHYVPDDFKYYSSGIFNTSDCHHSTTINHSSLLVGYDFTKKPPFFKLKNSWGEKWGEKGYYKVEIGSLDFKNPGFCYLANNGFNVFPLVF